ncbi:unnamed protein product [Ixodes pacificus]
MLDPASIRSSAHAVRRVGCCSKGTRAPDERTSQLRRAPASFPTSHSFCALQAEFRFCLSLTAPPPLHRTQIPSLRIKSKNTLTDNDCVRQDLCERLPIFDVTTAKKAGIPCITLGKIVDYWSTGTKEKSLQSPSRAWMIEGCSHHLCLKMDEYCHTSGLWRKLIETHTLC